VQRGAPSVIADVVPDRLRRHHAEARNSAGVGKLLHRHGAPAGPQPHPNKALNDGRHERDPLRHEKDPEAVDQGFLGQPTAPVFIPRPQREKRRQRQVDQSEQVQEVLGTVVDASVPGNEFVQKGFEAMVRMPTSGFIDYFLTATAPL